MIFIEVYQRKNIDENHDRMYFSPRSWLLRYSQQQQKQAKKEENLKPKKSENCLQIKKYLKIIPKDIPCCRGLISWSYRSCGIFLGGFWLRYINLCFSLLRLSVLMITKLQETALAPEISIITIIYFSRLEDIGYGFPVHPLIFLWMNIVTLFPVSHYSDSVS